MNVRLKKLLTSREFGLLIVFVTICAIVQFFNPLFLTGGVIDQVLRNYSFTILMTSGMLMVLLVGGIDISVGSTLALSGMTSALLMRDGVITQWWMAYLVSLGVGLVCGLLVGLVVTKGKVLPIIASLGFMYVFRGLTFFISDGSWVSMVALLEDFRDFSQGTSIGISNLIWIAIIVYILAFIMLKWTKMGRQIYAVGSNPEAAVVSGIRSDRIKLFAYVFNGALAGISGAMWVGFYAGAQSNIAEGLELDIIAACVIGGVSLKGGQGTIPGVLLGALTIAVINRALGLLGIDPFWQQALKGAVILIAVMSNILIQRRSNRRTLARREI